jgi:phosphatidylethanolamine/phosphatidyl-N-methylethanolamine N-methyltransferase
VLREANQKRQNRPGAPPFGGVISTPKTFHQIDIQRLDSARPDQVPQPQTGFYRGHSKVLGGMAAQLDKDVVARAYTRWAPVYDLVFGTVFARGRRASIAAANRIGGRILEVGVGTGISLPGYTAAGRVVGIDLSPAMLQKARQRVALLSLGNVEALEEMDGEHLAFHDASFDAVVANYVISTMPHPESGLDECARVLKPGGELIVVSRVGAEAGLRHLIERWLQPIVRRLGWRTDFPWQLFAGWTERHSDMRLVERREMAPFGHFSLLRFEKSAESGVPA